MSSATWTQRAFGIDTEWTGAGVVFSQLIRFAVGSMDAVGTLIGVPSVASGWVVHLGLSIGFGLLYAALVEWPPLGTAARCWSTGVGTGFVYGAVLWLVNLAIVWPIWFGAVGFPPAEALPIPSLPVRPLVGHLVYVAILGVVYPLLR